jgi:hypothetical protein
LEVKYESQLITARDIQGLINFCDEKESIPFGYVLTKAAKDIGLLETKLYLARAKTWNFNYAKAPGLNRSKATPYYNIGSLSIVQPRELSRCSKSKF